MVKYLVSALNINLFLRIGTAKSSEKIFSKQESQGKIFFFFLIMIHTWKGIESSILVERRNFMFTTRDNRVSKTKLGVNFIRSK